MIKLNQIFKEFHQGMKDFTLLISMIVNSILLLAVYLLGVGLTSLIAKISGKQFLLLKKKKTSTYWEDLNLKKRELKEYYRQF